MKHNNPTTRKISDNFERFNPYAAKALELDEDAEVYATLAFAFELSQLRYQISRKSVDSATVHNLQSEG